MNRDYSKIKVLIIDDDNLTLLILEKTLLKYGFIVEIGNSAVDAIKLLTEKSFDIVISDIKMPNLSGFDLMIWMKSNKINSKLIMMSSDVTPSVKRDYERFGVLQILKKPFTDEILLENINFALDENFNADISNLSMFDLVKILIMSNKDRGIVVKSNISEKTGVIFIKNGQVVFAQYDNIIGEKAFYNLMSIQNGVMAEIDFDRSVPQNISLPSDFLLMESARFIDDSSVETLPENIRILAVDDDPLILKIIDEFLSKKSCIVTTETSSAKALELIKENKYNFLISDINMPEFNGFQLLDAVAENELDMGVIFITGNKNSDYEYVSIDKGALKYFEKPLNLNELYNAISVGIEGSIHEVTLLDYVQLMVNSQMSSLIAVSSPSSSANGKIYIRNGRVVHAEYDNLVGEDAFYQMAMIKRGFFSQLKWEDPPAQSIDKAPIKLLINFSNILDSSNSEKEKDLHSQVKAVNQKVEMELIKAAMQMAQEKNKNFISFDFQFPSFNQPEVKPKLEEVKVETVETEQNISNVVSTPAEDIIVNNENLEVSSNNENITNESTNADIDQDNLDVKEEHKNENLLSHFINTDESPIFKFFKNKIIHKDS